MEFIKGIFAIIMVIIILAMKDSEIKWIAFIGWGIYILVKLFH